MSSLNYAQLWAILGELGFKKRSVRGTHVLFAHDNTETIIVLPAARARDKVPMANIVSTRFMLDAKGIAPRERWETLVRRHSAIRQFPTLDTVRPEAFAAHVRRIATEGDRAELETLARALAQYAVDGTALRDGQVEDAAERVARAIDYGSVAKAAEDGFGIVLLGAVGRSKLKRGLHVSPKELHVLATLTSGARKAISSSRGRVTNAAARAYLAERGIRLD